MLIKQVFISFVNQFHCSLHLSMLRLIYRSFKPKLQISFTKVNLKQLRTVITVSKDIDIKNIRNIGIIAHIDAGKTTTTERILYYSGFTNSMGEVHDGDTIMDFMPQERERGITITSAAITFKWKKHKVNLIDTPGHVDFTIEVERSLCALDGSVVILDSSAGVEVQTLTVWRQASRYNIPSIIYLNKMDKHNADFEMSLSSLEQKLKLKLLVLHLPVGSGKKFSGVFDLITKRKLIWDTVGLNKDGRVFNSVPLNEEEINLMESKRGELIESLTDLDDTLTDKFLTEGQESLTERDLISAVRRITLKRSAVPVFCGSSYKNIGVQLLMDSILLYLPNPLERNERNIAIVDEKFCALVFKIIHDKKHGPLTFLRLYSGEINSGQRLYNANRKVSEKIGKLMIPHADEYVDVNCVSSGNIVVATGLKESLTGDTLLSSAKSDTLDSEKNVLLEVPDPVFFCSIEPPSPGAEKQLERALQCLSREDPTFQVEQDHELGQTIISGMGELHIQVFKERILREYGVNCYLGPLQVSYREMLTVKSSHTHVLDKNFGGTKNFVKICLAITPDNNAVKFKEVKVVVTKDNDLGKVRSDHLKLVNNGVKSALGHGPILGFPIIHAKVNLLWLEIGKGTSSPMITAAAAQCLQQMFSSSQAQLLEPIMMLSITSATGHAGRILNDLSQKRSQILDMQSCVDVDIISALTPLSELRGYSTDLRAMTSGTCSFTMEFHHYETMNQQSQAKAVEEVTGFAPLL